LDDAAEEKRAIEMAKQEEIQKEMKRFKELRSGVLLCSYLSSKVSLGAKSRNPHSLL
jgi:hypothetical protein